MIVMSIIQIMGIFIIKSLLVIKFQKTIHWTNQYYQTEENSCLKELTEEISMIKD